MGHRFETLGNVDRGAVQLNGVISSTSAMVAEQRNQLRALTASLNRSAAGLEAAVLVPAKTLAEEGVEAEVGLRLRVSARGTVLDADGRPVRLSTNVGAIQSM